MRSKKVRGFTIEKVLDLPADKIWEVIGGDYGAIPNSHPTIVNSEYTSGSLKGAEGAERICYFNNSGSKYLHERMINFDPPPDSKATWISVLFFISGISAKSNFS